MHYGTLYENILYKTLHYGTLLKNILHYGILYSTLYSTLYGTLYNTLHGTFIQNTKKIKSRRKIAKKAIKPMRNKKSRKNPSRFRKWWAKIVWKFRKIMPRCRKGRCFKTSATIEYFVTETIRAFTFFPMRSPADFGIKICS